MTFLNDDPEWGEGFFKKSYMLASISRLLWGCKRKPVVSLTAERAPMQRPILPTLASAGGGQLGRPHEGLARAMGLSQDPWVRVVGCCQDERAAGCSLVRGKASNSGLCLLPQQLCGWVAISAVGH